MKDKLQLWLCFLVKNIMFSVCDDGMNVKNEACLQCQGHCKNGVPCNKLTGRCDNGCDLHWIGEFCQSLYSNHAYSNYTHHC